MPDRHDDVETTLGLGRKRRRGWIGVIAIATLAAAVGGYLYFAGDAGGQVRYVTEPVARQDIEVTVSATGSVEPTDLVEISTELSGTVKEVLVDFNDEVEVGTLLATLDTSKLEAQLAVQEASLAAAKARVTMAEATLDEAAQTYRRGRELQERGVQSDQLFLSQKAAFERAEADLVSAKANVELAQANLDMVRVDLTKSCICSPINGVVLDRDIDEGQIVAASLSAPTLFTLAEDLTRMELQVDIDEADIGRVALGQDARFTVEAHDEREFPATIAQVRYAPETVDGVVTYKAILTLDNADLALRPGMTATADIVVARVEDALAVPNAALRYSPPSSVVAPVNTGADDEEERGGGLFGMLMPDGPDRGAQRPTGDAVWVLRDGAPESVTVETGETDGTYTAILGGDLEEGDRVITDHFDAD